jgi:hypothetical protein
MIKVNIPLICENEQRYILDIVLGEFLGLPYELQTYAGDDIELTVVGNPNRLTVDSSFFHVAEKAWLKPISLPSLPLEVWDPTSDSLYANIVNQSVPVLYGEGGLLVLDGSFHLKLDIFGSSFFMLSRYEELVTMERDSHQRFSAISSIAFKGDFLERPIVNEYVEILWETMSRIWPELVRIKRSFRMLISCDVDHPFDLASTSLSKTARRILARCLRDKNPTLAARDGLNYIFKKFGSDRFDSYRNNIDWMMLVNQKAGNVVVFNFIPIQTDAKRDDPTNIASQSLMNLLECISTSGHQLGIHPGYKTFDSPLNIERSVREFSKMCSTLGISHTNSGGRQHYLRYDIGITPRLLDSHGLSYDSSLGFADKAGYRCGTCYEYSMYDLIERNRLRIKQRPLVAMDCTIVSDTYEGLGFSSSALERFEKFKSISRQFNGDYSLLWHNSFFMSLESKQIYTKLVSNGSIK